MTDSARCIAALSYLVRGWWVFPCKLDKSPYTPHGFKDATQDPEQVRAWWQQWPEASIGIDCERSGLTVIDKDPRHGGEETLARIRKTFPLPDTYTVATGGEGEHFYFGSRPLPGGANKLGPGLDVKSAGGYVIAAGSGHESGREYRITRLVPVAELPEWLERRLLEGKVLGNGHGKLRLVPGTRNDTLASIAGVLRRQGLSAEALAAALQVENQRRCDPPLPDAEVEKIARSIARYEPEPDTQVKTFALTDMGNGERFADRYGADIRYVHVWKTWLIWDGARWEKDTTQRIRKLARETVRSLYRDAKMLTDQTEQEEVGPRKEALARKAKALIAHGVKSEATGRVDALLKEAQKDCAIDQSQLDRDPWLLNVDNGTVDLRTGALKPHARDDLVTKIITTPYDPDASCPLWEQFLWDVMGGNEELIDFLWKATGYSITGDKREDCVFFLYGTGANGKGTFQNTLRLLFADYAKAADFSTFLHRQYDTVRNDLADLVGARFVTAGEPDQGQRLSEALVKKITGWDPLKARFLFQELFEFVPQMKCWLAFNFKPVIKGQDHGIWRRIRLIPFTQKFEGDRKDGNLREKLLTELPGILAWCVRGAVAWYQDGLPFPDAVKGATETYKQEMDSFGQWLEERTQQKPHLRTKAVDLYNDFIDWSGEKYLKQNAFGRLLTERGFARWSNRAWVVGIGLLNQSLTE